MRSGLRFVVPQSCLLSTIFFRICMKPVAEIVRQFGLLADQYADDTYSCLS